MFGSPVLEVILGVAATYGGLGLLCAMLNEWIASALRWRSKEFASGVRGLLLGARDADDREYVDRVLASPLVRSAAPRREDRHPGEGAAPARLPARAFTVALIEAIRPPDWRGGEPTYNDVVRMIDAMPDSDLKAALAALQRDSGHDGRRLRENLDGWYDRAMDHVSARYRKRMWATSLGVAALLVLVLRVDALEQIRTLWQSSSRGPTAAAADAPAADRPRPHLPAASEAVGEARPSPRPPLAEVEVPSPLAARTRAPGLNPAGGATEGAAGEMTWAKGLLGVVATALRSATEGLGFALSTLLIAAAAPFGFELLNRVTNARLAEASPRPSRRGLRPEPALPSAPTRAEGHPADRSPARAQAAAPLKGWTDPLDHPA